MIFLIGGDTMEKCHCWPGHSKCSKKISTGKCPGIQSGTCTSNQKHNVEPESLTGARKMLKGRIGADHDGKNEFHFTRAGMVA